MADEENDLDFDAYIADITPDVMRVLAAEKFFAKLETLIFPDGTVRSNTCDHTYKVCDSLLAAQGHDEVAREDLHDVMRASGGFCDCEIQLNAAPESAAKAAYWKQWASEQKQ